VLTDPDPDELDSEKALRWKRSRINTSVLPDRCVVIEFRFSDDKRAYWIVVEPEIGVSVCLTDPGFDVDIVVRTDVATLSRLWQGRGSVAAAERAGDIEFEGPRALARRMPEVLTITHPSVMGVSSDAPRPRIYAA
jgi:hypothetical protein